MSLYGVFTASFFFILIFLIQLIAYKCFLKKYADDWIQTADLLCQKQLLCQLSYNLFLLIFFTCMAICLVSVSRYSEVPSSGLLIGKTICSALYLSSFLLLWICSFSPFSMKSVSLKYKNDLGGVQIFWKMKKSFKFLKGRPVHTHDFHVHTHDFHVHTHDFHVPFWLLRIRFYIKPVANDH